MSALMSGGNGGCSSWLTLSKRFQYKGLKRCQYEGVKSRGR